MISHEQLEEDDKLAVDGMLVLSSYEQGKGLLILLKMVGWV